MFQVLLPLRGPELKTESPSHYEENVMLPRQEGIGSELCKTKVHRFEAKPPPLGPDPDNPFLWYTSACLHLIIPKTIRPKVFSSFVGSYSFRSFRMSS